MKARCLLLFVLLITASPAVDLTAQNRPAKEDASERLRKERLAFEKALRDAELKESLRIEEKRRADAAREKAATSQKTTSSESSVRRPAIRSEKELPRAGASLRAGAAAFFGGDYRAAIAILEPEATASQKSLYQIHLLRSASLYALYLLDRERDRSLLERAQHEVSECRRIDSVSLPDRVAFSPRFIEFFQQSSSR